MAKLHESVASEHIFHFRDGAKAHNLSDLRHAIANMSIDEYNHHVDEFNNDFANWVEFVFKDSALADDMRKVTSQKQILEILDIELGKFSKDEPQQQASTQIESIPVEQKAQEKKMQSGVGLHENPIEPSIPVNTFKKADGTIHPTIGTEAVHHFIVKEFVYGAIAGLLFGIILMALLFASGVFA